MRYLIIILMFPTVSWSYDVPERTPDNVIVAAYNIQFLGSRDHDLDKLARVIANFDVCGIVEVKKETEVAELTQALETLTGEDWGYVYGIRTHRPSGRYHEAYAAVWRKDRAQLGDGIVSGIWDLEEAFRNDPYIVSFKAGNFDFALILIHTRWTDDEEGTREGEVKMMAEQILWMQDFLPEKDLIVAGDFNYPGSNQHMQYMALTADLTQVDPNEKTTFKRDNSGYASEYDHIYISSGAIREYMDSSAALDATTLVYGSRSTTNMRKSKSELSDHLPVWAIFSRTATDDD